MSRNIFRGQFLRSSAFAYVTSDPYRLYEPLLIVANARAALLANKIRDFAAERGIQDRPAMRDLATGELRPARTRDEYNAAERSYARRFLAATYQEARRRAMRPVASRLRQADMLAMAQRCVNRMDEARAAYAQAVAA